MTFWDHLDELRKSLTYPVIVLLLLTAVLFMFLKEPLFDFVLAANRPDFISYKFLTVDEIEISRGYFVRLINSHLPAQVTESLKVSFMVALTATIPYLLYRLFRFITPALYENERKYSGRIIFSAIVSFFIGIFISYYVIFPVSLRFLASFQVSEQVDNLIELSSYINTLMALCILMGICFELPVVSWIMSRLGVLKSSALKKYRRHSFVGILILAAVITPTTDVVTLLLVSLPISLLYELSIVISRVAERSRNKTLELESM